MLAFFVLLALAGLSHASTCAPVAPSSGAQDPARAPCSIEPVAPRRESSAVEQNRLCSAAAESNLDLVKQIIDSGVVPSGYTVWLASTKDNLDMFRTILQASLSPSDANFDSLLKDMLYSVVCQICDKQRSIEYALVLLQHGYPVRLMALEYAIERRNLDLLKVLVPRYTGPKLQSLRILEGIASDDEDVRLLDLVLPVFANFSRSPFSGSKKLPLLSALEAGHYNVARCLLRHWSGQEVSGFDSDYNRIYPINVVIKMERLDLLHLLLEHYVVLGNLKEPLTPVQQVWLDAFKLKTKFMVLLAGAVDDDSALVGCPEDILFEVFKASLVLAK